MDEQFHVNDLYILFHLQQEVYAVNIEHIIAVERLRPITRVPRSHALITGVLNIRGEIIPLIDIHQSFGIQNSTPSEHARLMIFQSKDLHLAILTDLLEEVTHINPDQIEDPHILHTDNVAAYITGISKVDHRIVTVLDVHRLFGSMYAKS